LRSTVRPKNVEGGGKQAFEFGEYAKGRFAATKPVFPCVGFADFVDR